jgi:hypothetical protein
VIGGFAQIPKGKNYSLLAQNLTDGLLGPWYPDTNGKPLGPEVFATEGRQLFVGGDFTTVNNKPQQGFTRFEPSPDIAPPIRPAAPRVASVEPGTVKITFTATYDRDQGALTYTLLRDGGSTPIKTWTAASTPWAIPTIVDEDEGLEPGSTHTYRVQVTDGVNALKSSTSLPVTVAGTSAPYPEQVKADFPSFYWRLGEGSGGTAADATGNGGSGIYVGSVTKGVQGAVGDSDTAVAFNGSGLVASAAQVLGPQTFSVEGWFKTTTRRGGKLIGFGNSQTGTSSRYDRHVYMTDAGRLVFGVFAGTYPGSTQTIVSPAGYNDGDWHHFVGALGRDGMVLYVDGAPVGTNPTTVASFFSGYWRAGGDNLNGWPSRPSSSSFSGVLDELAVYDPALTANQVAARHAVVD